MRDKIPSQLVDHAQWVTWRDENGNKVPYHPRGFRASKTNPEHFSTFDQVMAVPKKTGIGFCFTVDDDFVGIDLDGCRDPKTGKFDDWAKKIIEQLDSYTEVSPSGTGVKIIVLGASPWETGRNVKLELPNKHGKDPGFECYDHSCYFTITGQRLKGKTEIKEVSQDVIRSLFDELPTKADNRSIRQSEQAVSSGQLIERARKYISTMPGAVSGQNGHGATFRVACVLALGFELPENDVLALLREFNERCEPPWSERELEHKVKSALKQSGPRGFLRDAKDDEWSQFVLPTYETRRDNAANRPTKIKTIRESVEEYIGNLVEAPPTKYSTGIDTLDMRLHGGFSLGSMIVYGARNGEAKSIFGGQIIYGLAEQGLAGLMVSDEMSEKMFAGRTLQYSSNIDRELWHERRDELRRDAANHFDQRAGLYAIYNPGHIDAVVAAIRQSHEDLGVQAVVVDYAQRIQGPGRSDTETVSNVTTTLGRLARELDIILLLLAQVNREPAKLATNRTTGKQASEITVTDYIPTKHDLKQSGRLEEEADVCLMGFHVKSVIHSHPYPNDYLIRVVKSRDDECDQTPVYCNLIGRRMRICDQGPLTFESDSSTRYSRFDEFNER